MLFDSVTVENFKKLAYDKNYAWKMMLVANKMSDEAGEEAEKITSYRHSLTKALKPYSLNDFPVCFIDAKDYQVYGEITKQISLARKQNEDAIASSNTWMQELISIRQEFEAILKMISLANEN